MAGVRERFFEEVGREGHVRLLEHSSGTILIELKDEGSTERWYVTIHRGDVSVSRKGVAPDCTMRTDGKTFDAIIAGKMNTLPALLRGLAEVEGRVGLLVAMQALYQPSAGHEGDAAGYARRQA